MRISDWSSDVCSSDLRGRRRLQPHAIYQNEDRRLAPGRHHQRPAPRGHRRSTAELVFLMDENAAELVAVAPDTLGHEGDALHFHEGALLQVDVRRRLGDGVHQRATDVARVRSEEHTPELQALRRSYNT